MKSLRWPARHAWVLVLWLLAACGSPQEDPMPAMADADASHGGLTPRALFFEDPERTLARISPNGQTLAWLARTPDGTALWTAPAGDMTQARPVAAGPQAAVFFYEWAANNTHVIYGQLDLTTRSKHLFAVDIATGDTRDLTPDEAVGGADLVAISFDHPDTLLISARTRENGAAPDVFQVDMLSGARERVFRNDRGFARFHADAALQVRMAEGPTPDGGWAAYGRDTVTEPWRLLSAWTPEDALLSKVLGFDASGRQAYLLDSTERDSAALVRLDLESGERTVMSATRHADVTEVWVHPANRTIDAFAVERLERSWTPLTANGAEALETLRGAFADSFHVTSRSLDDRLWSVFTHGARNPGAYHLLDRATGEITLLFATRPRLSARVTSVRKPVLITAADGLSLVAHLTLPSHLDTDQDGSPDIPAPLIVIPVDGPSHRHPAAFDPMHAFLADRGYGVLAVNTRGAHGYGKRHINAAAGEWGAAVQEDLAAAARWALDRSVAQPGRVGAAGALFGGHAALLTAAEADGPFACAAAFSPIADLIALAEQPLPQQRPYAAIIARMVGDPNNPDQVAQLRNRSLAVVAPQITRPALAILGEASAGAQAQLAREALLAGAAQGAPLIVAGFPDEAEFPLDVANRVARAAVMETFFADCLGGGAAPARAALAPSSLVFHVGEERLFPAAAVAAPADAPPPGAPPL